MDVTAAHVQQCAAVGIGADDLLDVRTTVKANLVFAVDRFEVFFPGAQGLFLASVEAHVAVAVAEVGIDVVLGDAVLDDVRAQVADLEDLAQTVLTHVLLDLLQVVTDAGHDLTSTAPGATETQVTRLQHNDVGDAFFGELKRGIDAGETTA